MVKGFELFNEKLKSMCSTADGVKNQKKTTSLSYTDIFQVLSETTNARFVLVFFNLLLKGQNDYDIYIKISHLMKLK